MEITIVKKELLEMLRELLKYDKEYEHSEYERCNILTDMEIVIEEILKNCDNQSIELEFKND